MTATLRRFAGPGAFLALVGLLIPAAYYGIFTRYAGYDDEGYLLQSLRQWVAGGVLYQDVLTQYGPFYYELFGGLFELTGRPVTQNAGRMLQLACWVGAAAAAGAAVRAITGSWIFAMTGAVVGFVTTFQLTSEPMHPAGLLTLLLGVLVLVLAAALPIRPRAAAAAAGAVCAAMALTKINAGGFAVIGVLFGAALALGDLRRRTWLWVPVVALGVATAPLIMRGDLESRQWQDMATIISGGALAVLVATLLAQPRWSQDGEPGGGRWVMAFLGGGLVATVVICAVAVQQGTGLGTLLDGVVITPARQPDVYVVAWQGTQDVRWLMPLMLVAAAGAALFVRRQTAAHWLTGALRVVAGLGIWLSLVAPEPGRDRLAWALLLAWVAALPRAGAGPEPAARRFARFSLLGVAIIHATHGFPVVGTQSACASLAFVAIGAYAIADGFAELRAALAAGGARWLALLRAGHVAVPLALLAVWGTGDVLERARDDKRTYDAGVPLPFEGADRLHLPETQVQAYAGVVARLRDRCETYVSLPGINIFYLWAGLPAPRSYPNTWMRLLDGEQQQRIVDEALRYEHLCLLRSTELLNYWNYGRDIPPRPLGLLVQTEFVPGPEVGGFFVDERRRSGR